LAGSTDYAKESLVFARPFKSIHHRSRHPFFKEQFMHTLTSKITKLILSVVMGIAALAAHALEVIPYTADAPAQAQKADKPVAVHFHVDRCPTCRAQSSALEQLKSEKGLDITVLVANYDTEKALKQRFNIRAQSTLVVLHGQKETERLAPVAMGVGMTGSFALIDMLLGALGPALGLRFTQWMLPIASSANAASAKLDGGSLMGAILLGGVL
jgi:thiol-disulfide isomerase/thioredoxin